jgi:phosphohistidine swiveling domain-containing protein
MTGKQAKRMHFVVTGEGLTNIARSLFLEDTPSKAGRFLERALHNESPGLAENAARRVLEGDAKLVGDMDPYLDLVDDDDTAYKAKVKWLYAGRIRIKGVWYRPRAYVSDYGPQDAYFAKQSAQPLQAVNEMGVNRRWVEERTRAYAYPGEIVVPVDHKKGVYRRYAEGVYVNYSDMIFEPCGEPPHWWPEHRNATEALLAFEAAGRELEVESHKERFGEKAPPELTIKPVSVTKVVAETAAEAEARLKAEEARELRERQVHRTLCVMWRRQILTQNGEEMIDLVDQEGRVRATVPRKPFEAYALERTKLRDAVPWDPVCPSGLKLAGDSRNHTDWYIGAGNTLEEGYPYDGPLHAAAVNTMYLVQKRMAQFSCGVIVTGDDVYGVAGEDIIILPNLAPEHAEKLLGAKGVITEAGGQLAHLAQVALERSIPIMLVPDARTKYPPGTYMSLHPSEGCVEVDITG